MEILKTGTRLKDECGTWVIYQRTVFDGRLHYEVLNSKKSWRIIFPCEIGKHYEVIFRAPKDCRNDFFTEELLGKST